MNNDKFQSQGYLRYLTLHAEVNNFIKLSVASIDYLSNIEGDDSFKNNLICQLIQNAGEKWTEETFTDLTEELCITRTKITLSAIMWVYSAFDVFLSYVHTYCDSRTEPEIVENDRSTGTSFKLEALFDKYNWSKAELQPFLRMFDLYTEIRHGVVHNMGRVNLTVKNELQDATFHEYVRRWQTVVPGRELSPPPSLREDGSLEIRPHHAIIYSEVCRRIAGIINKNLLLTVGLKEYIRKVAKFRLLQIQHLTDVSSADMYTYLRHYLRSDYNIDTVGNEEIKIALKGELLEKCKKKWKGFGK